MNCEKCQELISDLLSDALSRPDEAKLNVHLQECLHCAEVRKDLESIVGFCRTHRGEYAAPPNERALWLRIRNMIEGESTPALAATPAVPLPSRRSASNWLNRSWELSLPQLAASVAAIVLVVSLTTIVGLRRWDTPGTSGPPAITNGVQQISATASVSERTWQQQQAISYWNQRVEMNKARWNQAMREAFDRNMRVIDQTVSDSLTELNRNPHDEVSEEMLNAALNEKLAMLKEFADL